MLFKTKEEQDKFRTLLDEEYSWPDYYQFKFIVKQEHKEQLLKILETHEVEEKNSRTGKYVSISTRVLVHNAQEVISIYESVKGIQGIISL